jgi:hypothetical protein
MGPTPVAAVFSGTSVRYDVDFVFGETSAVRNYWYPISPSDPIKDRKKHPTKNYYLGSSNTREIGTVTVTKKVGANIYTSVNGDYKKKTTRTRRGLGQVGDVAVDISSVYPEGRSVFIAGDNVPVRIALSTAATGVRTAHVALTATFSSYRGDSNKIKVFQQVQTVVLGGDGSAAANQEVTITIPKSSYIRYLRSGSRALHYVVSVKIAETDEIETVSEQITLRTLEPVIQASVARDESGKVSARVELSIANPLPIALTNVKVIVSVPVIKQTQFVSVASIAAGASSSLSVSVPLDLAVAIGRKRINVHVVANADELKQGRTSAELVLI